MMIRRCIDWVRKTYEEIGATREGEGKEDEWRTAMREDRGREDRGRKVVRRAEDLYGPLVDTNPAGGLLDKRGQWKAVRKGQEVETLGHWSERGTGDRLPEVGGDREDLPGDKMGDQRGGENPGGELNPGGVMGDEIRGEIPVHGEIPEAEVEKLMVSFELSREEAKEVIRHALVVEARVLQDGSGEVVIETSGEHDMRMLGPLTWGGVDGWMNKVVVGDGRVWRQGVGWVRLKGRKVREVVRELTGVRKGVGLVKGRRVD